MAEFPIDPQADNNIVLRWISATLRSMLAASGGGSSPGAPAQVATASGANGVQRDNVVVGTASTPVVAANSTARNVTITHPGGTNVVYLSRGRAAVVGAGIPLYPGGSYETPTPTTQGFNGIVASGTESVTPFEDL